MNNPNLVNGHVLPDQSKLNSKTEKGATQSPTSVSTPPLTILPSVLEPGLYIVSTPIGNLRDITLRALDILASADNVLAEDTRQSQKLLNAYGLKVSLTAYHDHNAAKRVPNLVKQMQEGASLALISDAGTPLVSDPGFKLARASIDAGLDVFAVPGASSALTALVSSGLASDKFMFVGFLPAKSAARQSALKEVQSTPASLIFFESAGRLSATLKDMLTVFGDRQVVVARELTKRYEEIIRGSVSELLTQLGDEKLRGEIVVVCGPPTQTEKWSEAQIDQALIMRVPELGVKRASEEISSLSGQPKRDVYQRALALKNG